jgi:hypothetical protein
MKILESIMYTVYFIAGMISTGCLIYIVMFLDALRKGWLV